MWEKSRTFASEIGNKLKFIIMANVYVCTIVNMLGEVISIENSVHNDKVDAFIELQAQYDYYKGLEGFNHEDSWIERYENDMDFYAEFGSTEKYVAGTINVVPMEKA